MVGNVNPIGTMRKQSVTSTETGLDPIVSLDYQFRFAGEMVFFQGILKSTHSLFGVADLEGTADHPDAAASGTCQVTYCVIGTLVVVTDHRILRELRISAHDENKRNVDFLDHLPQSWAKISRCFRQQNAVHSLRQQQLDCALFLGQVVIAVAEQKVVALFQRRIFGAADYHREKWICYVRHDDANGLGFLFDQAAGDQVRTVVQFANGILHPLAEILADVTLVINHGRHSKNRNAGLARNVRNAGCFAWPIPVGLSCWIHSSVTSTYQDLSCVQNVWHSPQNHQSGLGSMKSRTRLSRSWQAETNCRSVLTVGPKASKSSRGRPPSE